MGFFLFGTFIPYYGFFILSGIVCAFLFGSFSSKYFSLDFNDFIIISGILIGSGFLGAKLLYILVSFKYIDFYSVFQSMKNFQDFIGSGFVFFGGIIGGLFGLAIIQNLFKIEVRKYLGIITVCLGISHFFGRIGCLFAGCCHGIVTSKKFSIIYTNSIIAPNNVKLVPVQGIEAFCILVVTIVCIVLVFKKSNVKIELFYMFFYSIIRFILEFFRGDFARGKIFGFSTSQYISILVFATTLILIILKSFRTHKEKTKTTINK